MTITEYQKVFKHLHNFKDLCKAIEHKQLSNNFIPVELIDSGEIELNKFSEINQYLIDNNIKDSDIFYIKDSDIDRIVLIKHNNGDLEILEEIWDSEDIDADHNEVLYTPFINTYNNVGGIINHNELKHLTKTQLINWIIKHLGYYQELLDNDKELKQELKQDLKEQLKLWDIFKD